MTNPMNNVLTERFGLKYPIFGFAHSIDVICALAEAGCFAVYGATRDTPEEIEERLALIRSRIGDKPFGVDLVMPRGMPEFADKQAVIDQLPETHTDFVKGIYEKYNIPPATKPGMRTRFLRSDEITNRQVEAVLSSDVNIFACGIGAPPAVVAEAKRREMTTLALVGHPRHAQAALRAGADMLVAQGHEAGAHTGPIGTFALVPQIVDVAEGVPVLAAGGVATGRHIAASFALGAQGVWMGTAWLTSYEHALHQVIVDKLLAAGSDDTVISRANSGKTFRQIRTGWSEEWARPGAPQPLQMPHQDMLIGDLLGAIGEHEIEPLMHSGAGQSVAFSIEQKSVAQIVADLASQTEEALGRLS